MPPHPTEYYNQRISNNIIIIITHGRTFFFTFFFNRFSMYYLHRTSQIVFVAIAVRYVLLGNKSIRRFWYSVLCFLIKFIGNAAGSSLRLL